MCACVCDRSDVECVLCVFQGDVVGQRSVFRPHSVSGQFLRQRVHAGSGSAAHAALSGLVPLAHRPHRGHLAHPTGGTPLARHHGTRLEQDSQTLLSHNL